MLVNVVDCEGFGLKDGAEDWVIVVGSKERVVRFVAFVGDSVGGGKSLGWLRVATIVVNVVIQSDSEA